MQPMLWVGLGNPGPTYASTRHNAGFWLLTALATHWGFEFSTKSRFHGQVASYRLEKTDQTIHILMPNTFMNQSGLAVQALMRYYQITPDNLMVAHDEMDLPPGIARLKIGGSHAGHNGLRDIMDKIQTRDFKRVRIGIDRPNHSAAVSSYVLSAPSKNEKELILEAIALVVDESENIITHWAQSQSRLNQAVRPS